MNNESSAYPIINSETPPSIDPLGLASTNQFRWHNLTNGRIYEPLNGDWILIGDGISVDLTEDHIKITHLKIVDGIITKLTTQ